MTGCQVKEDYVASKYEYQVIDLDKQSEEGLSEAERITSILNQHGARGWELDRFFELDNGLTRLLLRKVTTRTLAPEQKLSVFS
jgi:hypothetical protein